MSYTLNQLYQKVFNKTPTPKIFTYDDAKMFALVWQRIYELSQEGDAKHISLLGGSTVFKLFAALEHFTHKEEINWDNLHLWWNDERIVPYSSTQSNYGELHRKYLSSLPIKPQNLHPVRELADDSYERMSVEIIRLNQEVEKLVAKDQDGVPSFDLVLLGLGDDGHSASLFPNHYDSAEEALHVHAFQPKTLEKRISQGIMLLNHAKEIIFLAAGADKAPVLSEIARYVTLREDFRGLSPEQISEEDEEYFNTVFYVRALLMSPKRYIYPAVVLAENVANLKFIFNKELYDAVMATFDQEIKLPDVY